MAYDFSVFNSVDTFKEVGFRLPKKRCKKAKFDGVTASSYGKPNAKTPTFVTTFVIPTNIIDELGWKVGDSVGFKVEKLEDGTFAIAIAKGGRLKLMGNTIKNAPTKALYVKTGEALDFATGGKIALEHKVLGGMLCLRGGALAITFQ